MSAPTVSSDFDLRGRNTTADEGNVTALSGRITEKAWRQLVVDYARLMGWSVYFTWTSIHSPAGFPDLVLVRRDRLIFAELKTDNGRPTVDQTRWLAVLAAVPFVEVDLWRPCRWPDVRDALA